MTRRDATPSRSRSGRRQHDRELHTARSAPANQPAGQPAATTGTGGPGAQQPGVTGIFAW